MTPLFIPACLTGSVSGIEMDVCEKPVATASISLDLPPWIRADILPLYILISLSTDRRRLNAGGECCEGVGAGGEGGCLGVLEVDYAPRGLSVTPRPSGLCRIRNSWEEAAGMRALERPTDDWQWITIQLATSNTLLPHAQLRTPTQRQTHSMPVAVIQRGQRGNCQGYKGGSESLDAWVFSIKPKQNLAKVTCVKRV